MLSAAYAILGVSMVEGDLKVATDLFEPKGDVHVQSLRIGAREWRRTN